MLAVSTLYGIDILKDNVEKCRSRLWTEFTNRYIDAFGLYSSDDYPSSVQYIISKNIIWGDALTLKTPEPTPRFIVFAEWSMFSSPNGLQLVKRRDFTFSELLDAADGNTMPLFSDTGEDVFIPRPIKDWPAVRYTEISKMKEAA
jgi:hypothetical protein